MKWPTNIDMPRHFPFIFGPRKEKRTNKRPHRQKYAEAKRMNEKQNSVYCDVEKEEEEKKWIKPKSAVLKLSIKFWERKKHVKTRQIEVLMTNPMKILDDDAISLHRYFEVYEKPTRN